jgi:hypothetical protein
LTFNNVAQPDYSVVSTLQMNNMTPVAGHFNPNINADEIALFDGKGNWYIDYNHTNNVGGMGTVKVSDGLLGNPVVGDFDGSGHIELATYQSSNQLWTFDLNPFGVHNIVTFQWGFPNAMMAHPVTADMNGDGVTDIGLFVPLSQNPDSSLTSGWYWLVSQGTPVVGTINTLAHAFNPSPFSNDLYSSFGNGVGLPLVGHWDPQLPAPTPAPLPAPAPTPVSPTPTSAPAPLPAPAPTATPTPTATSTPTPTLITPTLGFAPGNSTTVLGITYAIGRHHTFVGTTTAGVEVDLILSGSHVKGRTKIIGAVVTNSAGGFSFRLPAGLKNGSYTLEARAISPSGSSYQLSAPVAFKVGPAPHIKLAKPVKPKSTKPVKVKTSTRETVQAHPRAVKAARVMTISGSNGHLVDQAVHTLVVENRLFKKKGH